MHPASARGAPALCPSLSCQRARMRGASRLVVLFCAVAAPAACESQAVHSCYGPFYAESEGGAQRWYPDVCHPRSSAYHTGPLEVPGSVEYGDVENWGTECQDACYWGDCADCQGRDSGTGMTQCNILCSVHQRGSSSPANRPCPLGHVRGAGITCQACTRGKFMDTVPWDGTAWLTSCKDCPTGKWSGVRAAACYDCPAGKAPGRQGCAECSAGYFNAVPGSESCTVCAAGQYSPENPSFAWGREGGNTECTACDLGRYLNDPEDYHANLAGCKSCPSGKFAASTGLTECLACEAGKFQHTEYDDRRETDAGCLSCPSGKDSASGSFSAEDNGGDACCETLPCSGTSSNSNENSNDIVEENKLSAAPRVVAHAALAAAALLSSVYYL